MIAAHPARRRGRRNPIASGTFQDPPPRPGTFPRYTLMRFVHALDAIFELTAVVRKLLSHLIDAARHVLVRLHKTLRVRQLWLRA